jgi:ribosomal protein L37AE/L43A
MFPTRRTLLSSSLIMVPLVYIGPFKAPRRKQNNCVVCALSDCIRDRKTRVCRRPGELLRGEKANELCVKTVSRYITHACETAIVSNITHGIFSCDVCNYSMTCFLFPPFSFYCSLLMHICNYSCVCVWQIGKKCPSRADLVLT